MHKISPAVVNQLNDLVDDRQAASLLLGIDFLPVKENVQRAWPAQADASGNLQLAFDALFQAHGLRLNVMSKEASLDLNGHDIMVSQIAWLAFVMRVTRWVDNLRLEASVRPGACLIL